MSRGDGCASSRFAGFWRVVLAVAEGGMWLAQVGQTMRRFRRM